jgi:hypothetical protein
MNKEMIRIKVAEGLRICHLIDEDCIHPECITQGDTLQLRTSGETSIAPVEQPYIPTVAAGSFVASDPKRCESKVGLFNYFHLNLYLICHSLRVRIIPTAGGCSLRFRQGAYSSPLYPA